jgi:DHA3 family multidrug efflux protein-like MFS transporter
MTTFHKLLGIALVVITANNFVWFALTYWAYLSTGSVISTSTMGGIFLVVSAVSGLWFGEIVDHNKKKTAMLASSAATLALFLLGLAFFRATPPEAFSTVASLRLWTLIVVLLSGTIVGSIYAIAIPTLIGLVVPADGRAKANGMFGTVTGISFGITSVASGITLALGGMATVLWIAIAATAIAMVLLAALPLPEPPLVSSPAAKKEGIDLKGTIKVVRAIPGLFPLIFFTTFNNFLGGVFFALMDAYGLSLVSVEVWGALWGVLSLAFIIGGLYVAKKGLSADPVAGLFRINIAMWIVCVFFTIQPSVVLLGIGIFIWMFLVPFVEATEQTIFQKVVPPERLGRVFGFAHGVEQSASPVTAFLIGPIAEFAFIPFMTTGAGAALIGGWFGTGTGRGIALVFINAGAVGLVVTLVAMRSVSYRLLAARYAQGGDGGTTAVS